MLSQHDPVRLTRKRFWAAIFVQELVIETRSFEYIEVLKMHYSRSINNEKVVRKERAPLQGYLFSKNVIKKGIRDSNWS